MTGEQVCVHDVRDKREVARLGPVAEDDRRVAVQGGRDEQGDHGAILRIEVLARAEDVEVAQHHGLESIRPPERLAVGLARDLRRGIRRQRARQEPLVLGDFDGIPVGRRRSGEHHTGHPGLARREQHV